MIESWLAGAAAWVADNPGWLILALFATAMVESLAIAGIVVPGVAMLFGFAALAGKSGMPLSEALAWAGMGAVIGDLISFTVRSEEHTSELQSRPHLVCRLLLEKKKTTQINNNTDAAIGMMSNHTNPAR